jgi:DNA modification methylase
MSDRVEIVNGDSLLVLQLLDDNSVDAIVTDPPYGLSFMGKKWDYDVPSEELWRQCFRVLKAGGHLLCFAGTRTQHRMAVRIEDAGFEIRDMIAWVYGSGFPKSLDVSKAIDKNNGEVGRLHKFTEWMRTTGLSAKQINDATDTFMGSHYLTDKSQPAIPTRALWSKLRPLCGFIPAWVDELVDRIEAEREVVGKAAWKTLNEAPMVGADCSAENRSFKDITAPATPEAKQWQGWGTALKPALEPITVARKPLIGTVAENVLQHGTGAINVDGCRVGTEPPAPRNAPKKIIRGGKFHASADSGQEMSHYNPTQGRWPANFIHDGSEEVTDLLGSAARFFYCAKASKRDRDEGCEGMEERKAGAMSGIETREGKPTNHPMRTNHHPTVKPTDLMRYLCRLVTPPDGLVLDPFMGSGSTGKAAVLEGFSFIGIEREAEYVAIAQARINHVTND